MFRINGYLFRAEHKTHRRERHAVDQTLNALVGEPDEDQMVAVEGEAKTRGSLEQLRGFKTPDVPLGDVIGQKRRTRTKGEETG